jgi:hypothetical protein
MKQLKNMMLLMAFLMTACSKEVTMPEETPFGEVNFFFASTAIINGANTPGSKGYKVLIDTRDSTYEPFPDMYRCIYPYILQPGTQVPTYPYTRTEWIKFMRLAAGNRQLFLVDTAHNILDSAQVNLSPTIPTMVFLGDSLGYHRHIIANDSYTAAPGKIGLRVINLSPYTGAVYLTLNKQIPVELPVNTKFLDHTGFIPVAFSEPASVNVKAYLPSDSIQFLARTAVDMMPGHAYTLLITGYTDNDPRDYIDPRTKKTIAVNTNFAVTVLKNF